jgi:hypothetical protein
MPSTLGAIPAGEQGGNKLPSPPPLPAGQHSNNEELQRPKKDGYVDFFRRALQNLAGDTFANRQLAICIANHELEVENARAEKRSSSDHFQTVLK